MVKHNCPEKMSTLQQLRTIPIGENGVSLIYHLRSVAGQLRLCNPGKSSYIVMSHGRSVSFSVRAKPKSSDVQLSQVSALQAERLVVSLKDGTEKTCMFGIFRNLSHSLPEHVVRQAELIEDDWSVAGAA
jgi:hypothetical protein